MYLTIDTDDMLARLNKKLNEIENRSTLDSLAYTEYADGMCDGARSIIAHLQIYLDELTENGA